MIPFHKHTTKQNVLILWPVVQMKREMLLTHENITTLMRPWSWMRWDQKYTHNESLSDGLCEHYMWAVFGWIRMISCTRERPKLSSFHFTVITSTKPSVDAVTIEKDQTKQTSSTKKSTFLALLAHNVDFRAVVHSKRRNKDVRYRVKQEVMWKRRIILKKRYENIMYSYILLNITYLIMNWTILSFSFLLLEKKKGQNDFEFLICRGLL